MAYTTEFPSRLPTNNPQNHSSTCSWCNKSTFEIFVIQDSQKGINLPDSFVCRSCYNREQDALRAESVYYSKS